jgi:hypothetical protein
MSWWARNVRDVVLYAVGLMAFAMAAMVVRVRLERPPVPRIILGPATSKVIPSQEPPTASCFDAATLRAIDRMGAGKVVARARP